MRDPESDSRRGNPVLLVLLVVASLLLTTAYFREDDEGILHGAREATIAATAPLVTAGTAIASPFRALGRWVEGLGASREEIQVLREQNEDASGREERGKKYVDLTSQHAHGAGFPPEMTDREAPGQTNGARCGEEEQKW